MGDFMTGPEAIAAALGLLALAGGGWGVLWSRQGAAETKASDRVKGVYERLDAQKERAHDHELKTAKIVMEVTHLRGDVDRILESQAVLQGDIAQAKADLSKVAGQGDKIIALLDATIAKAKE